MREVEERGGRERGREEKRGVRREKERMKRREGQGKEVR